MIRLSEAIARANCKPEITPAFVREAYTLLRQSIIHVEQDDIDFDEEDVAGERTQAPAVLATDDAEGGDGDVEMSGAGYETMDESGSRGLGVGQESANAETQRDASGASSHGYSAAPSGSTTNVLSLAKRRMVITHDKYITLQSLIVLHLADHERRTGIGKTKDDLVDWYLEENESQFQDIEELEYEKELITKVLRKLVKV